MSERHLVAILTAVLRVVQPDLDADVAALAAIALARGGFGDREIAEMLTSILAMWRRPGEGWLRPSADEIQCDVDFALGMKAAFGGSPDA